MFEITMTIPEFNAIQRGEMSYNDLAIERAAKVINQDDRLRKMFAFAVGSLLYCQTVCQTVYAMDQDKIEKALIPINEGGFAILTIARTIGYWVCIIMCIIEIIKALLDGSSKNIGKIILKYVFGFAALYLLPWLLDLIVGVFGAY